MPQDYQTRIPQFDSTGAINAQQHIDRMHDFCDLHEVDENDLKLRLFAQSLGGEVRKWFKNLAAGSIVDLATLHLSFLNRWETKKSPLHILNEYKNLKRVPNETIEEYCDRFDKVYHAIRATIKPPPGLALIHFQEGFDVGMAYQLRVRDPTTLEDMQENALKVEANLLAKKAKTKHEKKKSEEPSSSSSTDYKIDILLRIVEKLMDRIGITGRAPPRENKTGKIQNPNFRRNQPQIRQRDPKGPD